MWHVLSCPLRYVVSSPVWHLFWSPVFTAQAGASSPFTWRLNVSSGACASISDPMINVTTVEAGAPVLFGATFVDAFGNGCTLLLRVFASTALMPLQATLAFLDRDLYSLPLNS